MADPFFDTNIIIDWLRRRPQAKAEILSFKRHRISRIVWAEVLAGEPPERRGIVEGLIRPFAIVELDATIAAAAADIRHQMRIKLLDAFILATAQVNGAQLITRNSKDFPAGTPGIRIPYQL